MYLAFLLLWYNLIISFFTFRVEMYRLPSYILTSFSNLFTLMCFLGKYYEKVCEMCYITLNKNAIFGDNGSISPGGVRIGEQSCHTALTTRLKKVSRRFVTFFNL
jgi:hypothetical protein